MQGLGDVVGNRTFQETALAIVERVLARMPRRKMGQPLDVMKTTLRLEPDVMAHLKTVAGPGGVAAFLHQAVLEKLDRQASKPVQEKARLATPSGSHR